MRRIPALPAVSAEVQTHRRYQRRWDACTGWGGDWAEWVARFLDVEQPTPTPEERDETEP